jgi:hypothetical protein
MARKNTGGHTVRNAAIAGAGLATGAAATFFGGRNILRERAVKPTVELDWSAPSAEDAPNAQPVDIESRSNKSLRHHLAVLSVNGTDLQTRLNEGHRPAIAVEGKQGIWNIGAFPEGYEMGQSPDDLQARRVAVRLGTSAVSRGVHVGTLGKDNGFVPLETHVGDVDLGRNIRKAYPEVDVIPAPPITEPRGIELLLMPRGDDAVL